MHEKTKDVTQENVVASATSREFIGAGTSLLMLLFCFFSHRPNVGILSLLLFTTSLVFTFFHRLKSFLKHLPFIFAVVANIAGCAACDYAAGWHLVARVVEGARDIVAGLAL